MSATPRVRRRVTIRSRDKWRVTTEPASNITDEPASVCKCTGPVTGTTSTYIHMDDNANRWEIGTGEESSYVRRSNGRRVSAYRVVPARGDTVFFRLEAYPISWQRETKFTLTDLVDGVRTRVLVDLDAAEWENKADMKYLSDVRRLQTLVPGSRYALLPSKKEADEAKVPALIVAREIVHETQPTAPTPKTRTKRRHEDADEESAPVRPCVEAPL